MARRGYGNMEIYIAYEIYNGLYIRLLISCKRDFSFNLILTTPIFISHPDNIVLTLGKG
jgi:hypothetical protein